MTTEKKIFVAAAIKFLLVTLVKNFCIFYKLKTD